MRVPRFWIRLLVLTVAPAVTGGCATASRTVLPAASRSMHDGPSKPVLAPLAFVSFCMRNRGQCRSTGESGATVQATPATMAAVESVNRQVNERIRPRDAADEWRINPATGNCNDYVVSKRYELLARGFPSSALIINVVRTPTGEGHLVLVVRTDHGDLVLDNLTSALKTVAQARYTWIKRQSAEDPLSWESA